MAGEIIPGDWTITRATKVIAYIGHDHDGVSPSYSTVIEFHRWLQGLADDAVASGDDELDITNIDPSRRSTDNIVTLINGYTIGDTEREHLYDGSVIYSDGDEVYDGFVNFGNLDVQIQVQQNGAVLQDDWWNYNNSGLNPSAAAGISHRFMLKTRTGGVDIDGRRLIGTCRRYGYTYAEFSINGTSRGNNVFALTDSADLNNTTAIATVSGWADILNTEGYANLDVDNNGSDEYYYSEWTRGAKTINQFYEKLKFLSRDLVDGSSETLYGLDGEVFRGITHQIALSAGGGTWTEPEFVTWGAAATFGSGQLFAVDNVAGASSTAMWIQLLAGVIPASNTITGENGGSATAGAVVERAISKPFAGASTGSALIGAYGLGVTTTDLTSNDKVTDLGNDVITPPNYVQNTVTSIVSGQDRVLVAPWDGVSVDVNNDPAIDKDQFILYSGLTTDNIVEFAISGDVATDTPSAGYVRVADNDGFERRLHFSSWTSNVFTIDTTDGNEDFVAVNADSGNGVYLGYIDKLASGTSESFTSVQAGSRNLVVVVRDGGVTPIKQFISSWSQTDSPQSISVIRTTDE